jgi:Glycosyl hydrolases family 16
VQGYALEVEDRFDGPHLDTSLWLPHHLPHWSSWTASAARYRLGDGLLRLVVEEDQSPWCPEFDGQMRVSSLQTGVTAGQHRFAPSAVVREAVEPRRLYTPQYGFFEIRMRVSDDPASMAALWMIGLENRPERSAEICIAEIFGRDVGRATSAVGMGVHPFGDPAISDDFAAVPLPIDAREFHVYAAEWTPDRVTFLVDGQPVRTVEQSPAYPMQFMLGVYAFPDTDSGPPPGPWPKECVVDRFRGHRPTGG